MGGVVNDTNTPPRRAGFFARLKLLLVRAAQIAVAIGKRIGL